MYNALTSPSAKPTVRKFLTELAAPHANMAPPRRPQPPPRRDRWRLAPRPATHHPSRQASRHLGLRGEVEPPRDPAPVIRGFAARQPASLRRSSQPLPRSGSAPSALRLTPALSVPPRHLRDLLSRPNPVAAEQTVREWLRRNGDRCFLSVVSLTEIAYGIAWLRHRGATAKASRVQTWYEEIVAYHTDRILPIDVGIAVRAGVLAQSRNVPFVQS